MLWQILVALSAHAATTHTVQIEGMKYKPEALVIERGDTVIWVNKDVVPHTVTDAGKAFDSKSIAPGATWKLRPKKSHEFSYKCDFHPGMKGSLTVK